MTRIAAVDEETPLLAHEPNRDDEEVKETPIRWSQIGLVLFLQLAEPLTAEVIFPFTPQLIRETGVTNGDDKKVGYYVGILVRFASFGFPV